MKKSIAPHHYERWLVAGLLLAGLYMSHQYSYVLFHGLAEVFSIVIACGVFMLAWNTRHFHRNSYLLFLGIAYLFIAVLDLAHMFAYKGMGVFEGYDANLPTQLWIAARYVHGISLLIAIVFLDNQADYSENRSTPGALENAGLQHFPMQRVWWGYTIVTGMLLATIFTGVFPPCYVESIGLTAFKKVSEYIIILLLLLSGGLLYQRRAAFDHRVLWMLLVSNAALIAAEMAFTLYIDVYDFSNLVGHILKIAAFYLVYSALVDTGLSEPFRLMFRDLQQTTQTLYENETNLRALIENASDQIWAVDTGCRLILANAHFHQNVYRAFGYTFGKGESVIANDAPQRLRDTWSDYYHRALQGEPFSVEVKTHFSLEPRWMSYHFSPIYTHDNDITGVVVLGRDITHRKYVEIALRQSNERLHILRDVDRAILKAQSSREVIEATLRHLQRLIPYNRATITEIDLDAGVGWDLVVIHPDGTVGYPEHKHRLAQVAQIIDVIQRGQIFIKQNLMEQSSANHAPANQDSAKQDPACSTLSTLEQMLAELGMRAYISVPMLIQDKLIGTLNLAAKTQHFFTPEYLDIAQEIATSLAVALHQTRLHEQTQRDAETQTLLLREINHRVKNNLATLMGLFSIEMEHIGEKDAAYRNFLMGLMSRVESLGIVYQMLSASQWTPLRLDMFIEQTIRAVVSIAPPRAAITVDVSPTTVEIAPNQANSLALVINELVTNTLKYALPEREAVRINVDIVQQEEAGQIVVIFHNDGPDYPEAVLRGECNNVGMYLIQTLVSYNLHGTVTLHNDGGPVTTLQFPIV